MYINVTSPAKPIPIGVVGENLSRVVVWDIGRWIADYGEGYAMLMAKRPVDEAPYPVPLVQSGNQALWRVRDVDLFAAGEGECQLSYAAGGQVVARTPVYKTLACRAIEGNPEDPENPGEGWVSEILQAGKDAQEGAAQAAQSAEEAGRSAASAAASAESAAQSAENAGKSEESAKGWADLAQQGAANAGWFYVYGEDGILYMVRSDNAPEDFALMDNGKGELIAVYGD